MTEHSAEAIEVAGRVEAFVRGTVVQYEQDARIGGHGPSNELVMELRSLARKAGVLTPHIRNDHSHLSHRDTALVLRTAGLSPLGPTAVNVMAPDEGNMFLLGRVASAEQRRRFLDPLIAGTARSAFFMTEPAVDLIPLCC
jgi:acyl-CoA dehydrogenase